MSLIRILDTATSNRIAAGEVVERPASIAKELIENALDAGAKAVTVEAREGGIEYLRVTDNGAGFPAGEVRIAFERHATSKLRSGDSLGEIATLGFRGEALPSIAAVSKVELTTRQAHMDSGVRLTIEGGAFKELREAGCPEGTTFVVRDLFFNTPARKAFLKRAATEGGYIGDAVLQQALARSDVSFRLVMNGRTVFHTPGSGDVIKTLQVLYGRECAEDLLPVEGAWPGGSVTGFIGLRETARANRQREHFFVNGRFVRSPLLATAVEEAVKGVIAIGKYPFCALYVDIPLGAVDVNVHPNKLEIRFRDEEGVRAGVGEAASAGARPKLSQVKAPLLPPEPAPLRERAAVAPAPIPRTYVAAESGAMSAPFLLPSVPPPPTPPPPPDAPEMKVSEFAVREVAQLPKTEAAQIRTEPYHRLIGVLFATYLLVETGDTFYLIDQHAAHERLLYDALLSSIAEGAASQTLLLPYIFDVTPREKERVLEHIELMREMGFAIEDFGPASLRVGAVPHILGEAQLRDFFIELLDNLEQVASLRAPDLKRDAIARIACHKAVKAGDRLPEAEIKELMRKVLAEDTPLTCPHGRPILLKMTRAQLEKRFGRTQ